MDRYNLFAYTSDIKTKNSLKNLRANEEKLNLLLKEKLKDHVLGDYLDAVWKVKSDNIDFIDFAIATKKNIKSGKENNLIYEISKLYNEILELEILNESRKSPEVSINILHNTHSSMNAKLKSIYYKDNVIIGSDNKSKEDNLEIFHITTSKEEIRIEYN